MERKQAEGKNKDEKKLSTLSWNICDGILYYNYEFHRLFLFARWLHKLSLLIKTNFFGNLLHPSSSKKFNGRSAGQ
jgi:hypothetical protein